MSANPKPSRIFVRSSSRWWKDAQDLFFTKDWDWSSETEYRFLLRGDTKDEESIDVREALEAVIAGPQFHRVYRPGLYKLCQELEVEPFQIQWQMGPPFVVQMPDPGDRPLSDRETWGGI